MRPRVTLKRDGGFDLTANDAKDLAEKLTSRMRACGLAFSSNSIRNSQQPWSQSQPARRSASAYLQSEQEAVVQTRIVRAERE